MDKARIMQAMQSKIAPEAEAPQGDMMSQMAADIAEIKAMCQQMIGGQTENTEEVM